MKVKSRGVGRDPPAYTARDNTFTIRFARGPARQQRRKSMKAAAEHIRAHPHGTRRDRLAPVPHFSGTSNEAPPRRREVSSGPRGRGGRITSSTSLPLERYVGPELQERNGSGWLDVQVRGARSPTLGITALFARSPKLGNRCFQGHDAGGHSLLPRPIST